MPYITNKTPFMKRTLLLLAPLALSSCLFGPDYAGPKDLGLPVTWVNALPPASDKADLATWWQSFNDPQLSSLIQQGFDNNPDIVTAALAIEKAQSILHQNELNLLPNVGFSAGGTNEGNYNTSTSHGKFNGALSMSWTPDVWGKTRRSIEAAVASVGSQEAAANATRTALAANIATNYFNWISAKEGLRIAKEQLAYQERTYSVTEQKTAEGVGMASALDLAEARANIANTRARIPQLEAAIRTSENRLATLLGTTVDRVHLTMPAASVYNLVPRVPVGLPSELLRRRPDVIRAEKELHAACANIGVEIAAMFPSVSLTGSTNGRAGTDFSHFWQSTAWSLTGNIAHQALNKNFYHEYLNQARIADKAAAENYRKTVLAAFAEVEESLITYAQMTNQLPEYEASRDANKQAAELSLRRYNAGECDFLNVASAENQWLAAELNIINTRQNIRIALAKLCTALGGGW